MNDVEPLYVRIAAALRERITSGDLEEGDRLPGERDLMVEWGTTRVTVAKAVASLRSAGLVVSRSGSGTFVRRRPTLSVRSADHYRRAAPSESTSPFARDAERAGAAPNWTWDTARVKADQAIATRLGVAVDDYVMRTSYVFSANSSPVQTSTSWEPWALVGGATIEEPEGDGRVVGVIARFDSIGIAIDRVAEQIRARPANDEERHVLEIPDDVWVQEIERTHYAGDLVCETATIIIPADRYLLRYEIRV